LDNVLAEVVEGNKGFQTTMFRVEFPPPRVNGCWQCHGTDGENWPGAASRIPPAWPNTGIGRINPDGSEGSCAACHSRT
jgi:cytochrome c553